MCLQHHYRASPRTALRPPAPPPRTRSPVLGEPQPSGLQGGWRVENYVPAWAPPLPREPHTLVLPRTPPRLLNCHKPLPRLQALLGDAPRKGLASLDPDPSPHTGSGGSQTRGRRGGGGARDQGQAANAASSTQASPCAVPPTHPGGSHWHHAVAPRPAWCLRYQLQETPGVRTRTSPGPPLPASRPRLGDSQTCQPEPRGKKTARPPPFPATPAHLALLLPLGPGSLPAHREPRGQ
ncbi:basic salivary proline-rich protein 3-like [Choloepus didactylus]|uniref:basic salivary proline-rich protein 3-like n=1 Tax=Choloepus didactylus TaxID=27675 RepID=UPI00189D5E03|nr:basic salivary proline-rich protein 3-like [Choloepus didactylus]